MDVQLVFGGLCSVVTPAYNSEKSIEKAILSVARQTAPVLEHIIVDDGSTDSTSSIVEKLSKEYPHIIYIKQNHQGAGAARNIGIKYAKGRYISFLDSDDWWREKKVEKQISFMENNHIYFSYGDYEKRSLHNGTLLSTFNPPSFLKYEDLLRGCPIGCLTATYNQEALGKQYMPQVKRGQDWGLWLKLTRNGTKAYKYPGNEAVYSLNSKSLSSNKLLKCLDIYNIYRNQNQLGVFQALKYLAIHTAYILKK